MSIFGGQQMTMYNYGARMPQQPANAAPIVYNNNSTQPQGMAAVYAAMGLQPGTQGTAPSQPAQSMAQAYAERGLAAGVSGQSPTSGASASSSIGGAADTNAAYRAEMGNAPVQTTVANPNQQYRDNFSSGVGSFVDSPEQEMQVMSRLDADPKSIDYILKNKAISPRLKAKALERVNQLGGSIPGGQQLGAASTVSPNDQYREYMSKAPVQTTTPTPTNNPNADYQTYFTQQPVQGIDTSGLQRNTINRQYEEGMRDGPVQTTAPETMDEAMARIGIRPGTAVGVENQQAAGIADVGTESMADAMARLGIVPGQAGVTTDVTATDAGQVQGQSMADAMARLGLQSGEAVGDFNQAAVADANMTAGTGTPVGSRMVGLAADAADRELLNRVQSGNLLDVDSTLGDAAQQNVLDRLTGNQLGANADLDAAMVAARGRLNTSGVDLDSNLTDRAQDVIMNRLLGGSNPLVEQQRADFLERSRQQQEQLRENLNRMGVLRSGDTAEALGDFIGSRERTLNDINALGYDLQSQALADALNFQGRRDSLNLANENLARGAIGDVAGLASQYDQRAALGAGLAGDAVSQALGLQGQQAEIGMAEQGLQGQALADVYGRQGQLSGLETDRVGRQVAVDTGNRAERALGSDLATASQQRALASAADQRAARGFESDLVTQDLQRRLAQAGDLRAAQALGSDLTGAAQQRELARAADSRAERGFSDDLITADLQRRLAQAGDLRATQALGSDLAGAAQQRRLAQSADERAGQAMRSDLVTQDLQRRLAEASTTGRYMGAGGVPETTLAGRAMGLEEDMARANDLRAQQQLESILFGQVQTGADSPIQTLAGQQAADDLQTQQLNRNLAMSDNARRTQLAQQDILNAIAGRGLQSAADQRAAQALSSDLSTADLQRRLSEADATGDFYARGYGQAPTTTLRARALDQDIAASQGAESRAERALTSDIVAQDLQNRLAQADRTGQLEFGGSRRPETTLQARRDQMTQGQLDRENETQRISQILAALDPALTGVRRDLRPFAQGLAGQINPDLASALGLATNTQVPPEAQRRAENQGLTINPDGTATDEDGNVFALVEEDGIEDWRPVSG